MCCCIKNDECKEKLVKLFRNFKLNVDIGVGHWSI